jgi:cellulose synthase operon protein B
MRALLASLLIAFGSIAAHPALAQGTPFSMSPGRPAAAPAAPAPPPSGPQGAPPTAAPFSMQPAPAAPTRPTQQPVAPPPASPNMAPQGPRPTNPPQASSAPRSDTAQLGATNSVVSRNGQLLERPLLPFESVRLDGENDSRSWTFHLTQDEAASGASISIGYQNAVVVMPEASRLRAVINEETVVNIPIASAQGIQQTVIPIRAGLLRGGQNIIRLEAIQRHRTDCTIASTYELWTNVDAASTKLVFAAGATKTLRSIEDLPAIGADAKGVTTIRVVAPRVYRPEIRDRLLRLVQMIALRGRYAHPVIQVVESDSGPTPVGTIRVIMGIASELRGMVAALPDAAAVQPLSIMMQDTTNSPPFLVVTGPTWNDLDTAINIVGAAAINARGVERNAVDTASWHWPEIPTVLGERSIRFSDMGVPTQEFSGRRLRVRFAVNLPADFYATDYGEAALMLDAAYTPAVKPGSHFDIYVNDRISATMTITSRSGVFRQHLIRVPLKNFKAGINHVSFEAILLTDADERCAPGETLSETNRFVLFDSTSFDVPDYGRMGRQPDLAVLSTGGFPYGDLAATFVLARPDPLNYAASGTLLARMARDSGEPVRAQFANAATAGDQSVIFIGTIDQLPPGLLGRVKVSDNLRMIWQSTPAPVNLNPAGSESSNGLLGNAGSGIPSGRMTLDQGDLNSTEEIRKRWTETFQRRGILQQTFDTLRGWMEQTFNLSLASLKFDDASSFPYEPPQRTTLLLAQNRTSGPGSWTVVTARTEEALAKEMARLTSPLLWSQVSGQAVALEPAEARLDIRPISDVGFVQTQPLSFMNLRLVAANWMSINILQYALVMVIFCILLGSATYLLLNRLGRRS